MAISPSLGFIVVLLSCIAILPHFSSAQGSCRTRCGEDYYRGYACHCDYNCLLHKECCPDYEGLCTTANSCKGRCGEDFQRGRKCNCDAGCLEFNQCCSDYQSHCLKETPKTTVAKPTTVPITTRANTPQVQATKKLAVNLSPLIQKPVPTTQSTTTASSRFQAIETTASDSNSANEEMIQDLSESQLITLSTLPPANQPTSRPAVTTMQLENLKYPEFQRDDETVLLELTEAMPYQEQFLPSFTHSFSTEPSAPSSVFSILQSTTEASTKPEEHTNPTEPLVLESDTIRPAVTEQTTPSAAVNDQESETPSESDTTGPAVTEQTTPSAAVNDQESETPSESDTTGPAVTEQTTPSAAVNDQESETPSESDTTGPAVTEQTTPSAAVNDQESETPSESDTTRPAVTEQTTTPSAAVNDQESETPSESDTTGPAVTEQTTTPSAAVNDQESETPSESDTTGPAVTEQTTTPSAAVNDQEPETPSESDTARPAVTEQTTPSAALNDQEPETLSESNTARPAVTEQTTPSAAVNDQEPDTPSESGFEPSMTDAPETDTPSPPEGDVPSASPTQTPASTSTLSLTITTPTNNPSDIFLPEFMTTVSNLEDSTSLPPYSTESSTPLIAFFTPKSTTGASEKPEEKANPTEPQASESSTTRPDISALASIAAIDNVEELSMTELQTPRGVLATPPGAENIPEPAVPTGTESVSPTNGAPSSASPTKIPTIMSTPSSTTTDPTRNVLLADDNDDDNLCSGRPVNGITTLLNGTMYAFRGHWFWMLNSYGIEVGYPRRITDVWGIPSPIDSVFTRCNCQGKTFFFKGSNYWRFENGGMDPGYPKLISKGFGGIKGQITAALSVSSSWRRPESVYFFKQGGLVQKYSYTQPPQTCKKMQTKYSVYSIRNRFARQLSSQSKDTVTLGQEINIKLQWRGFPTSVTSAVSVPNARKPDGYDYFVFSRTQYYNINILADQPTVLPSSERQRSTAKDWFKCP